MSQRILAFEKFYLKEFNQSIVYLYLSVFFLWRHKRIIMEFKSIRKSLTEAKVSKRDKTNNIMSSVYDYTVWELIWMRWAHTKKHNHRSDMKATAIALINRDIENFYNS